jgi:hypothetical protein
MTRPPRENLKRLDVGLGLAQALDAVARLPLTALFKDINAFESFQNIAFDDEAVAGLETVVLGHKEGVI